MKDEVNQAASAKVHSSGRAFEQFKEAINDEDFEDLLKDAQAGPKGVAAQGLLKKVLPFLSISSRHFFLIAHPNCCSRVNARSLLWSSALLWAADEPRMGSTSPPVARRTEA